MGCSHGVYPTKKLPSHVGLSTDYDQAGKGHIHKMQRVHATFRLGSKESFYWDKTGDECWENRVRNHGETSGTHPLPMTDVLGSWSTASSDTQVCLPSLLSRTHYHWYEPGWDRHTGFLNLGKYQLPIWTLAMAFWQLSMLPPAFSCPKTLKADYREASCHRV